MPQTSGSFTPDDATTSSAGFRGADAARNPGETRPANNGGPRRVGYARVSTDSQVLDRQEDALHASGVHEIFTDKISGMKSSRPGFDALLAEARPGDTIVCQSLDRLGRDVQQLLRLVDTLQQRGIQLQILQLGVDTGTISGRLVFSVLSAVSEMERSLLVQRTNEGLAAARARGRVGGRPSALSEAQKAEVLRLKADGRTAGDIAALFGCSTRTVRRVR
jgi:DNA invertase Pin-like site-specific DNA recombinase